jgi:SpoVK/Ycf46/Vps4 family AAA+-type ATPase
LDFSFQVEEEMGKADDNDFTNYKFKSLKVYGSTEWLGGGKKNYRRVFARKETTYIYAELALYNKLFDEEDWAAKITLTCFVNEEGIDEEICNVDVQKDINDGENITYVREGWGNAVHGVFWKAGEYTWKAYLDGDLVGVHTFHVLDEDPVTEKDNPYFAIESIKLFEGGHELPSEDERIYYSTFDGEDTRYVWAELNFANRITEEWHGEFFFNFYNHAGQLKGGTSELKLVKGGSVQICSGWGSDKTGTWHEDKYTLEIIFMDRLIAILPFSIEDYNEEGTPEVLKSTNGSIPISVQQVDQQNMDEASLNELIEKLDELIGLENVKQQIKDYVKYLKFIQLRQDKGFEDSGKINLHSVLTGNPGTGKTTVAKQLGRIYKAMGLLTRGHVHEVDRADLVGEFIGQTAPRAKKAIEKARGGILFIDEAYSLYRGEDDSKDFGKEVIEIVIKEMSDGPGNIAIVVAGYPDEMRTFIESNPGMKSRFNHYFNFQDYVPEELMEIAELGIKNRSLKATDPTRAYLFTKLTQAYRDRDRTFGNARFVLSVIDEAKMNMGLRLMQSEDTSGLSNEQLSTIELEDVQQIFLSGKSKKLSIQIDMNLLKEASEEMDELIGMEELKEDIFELVKLVKYYREIGKDVLNKFVLHSVYVGNPGTGKTTVARIMAKVFRALGILEKGHLVECDREGLVAGYSGQTAIKTSEMIDRALGGVLFIDEAYALSQGARDQFGMEAINTLLKRMEDNKEDFVVIAAGYPDNMHEFLETNPGLKSRFEQTLTFKDYSPEELWNIAMLMFQKEDILPDETATAHLQKYLNELYEGRDKFFGNAREVRKTVQKAVKNQHLRMASLPSEERTTAMITTLTLEDVQEFDTSNTDNSGRKSIGFR